MYILCASNYSVVIDPESYMTEYVAIRIVFTLQGLYTCTHSPRRQPADNSD